MRDDTVLNIEAWTNLYARQGRTSFRFYMNLSGIVLYCMLCWSSTIKRFIRAWFIRFSKIWRNSMEREKCWQTWRGILTDLRPGGPGIFIWKQLQTSGKSNINKFLVIFSYTDSMRNTILETFTISRTLRFSLVRIGL